MRKLVKRISAVVCAAALTVAMASTCFAADEWGSYFGASRGWNEGAIGELTAQSADSWTANMELIGWGGVWGAQVIDDGLDLKKGTEYNLKFDMTSDTIDKWVFIKVTDGEDALIYGEWIHVKKGSKYSYDKKITLDADCTKLVFGIGGDFGDRTDEADMYALTSEKIDDVDAAYATKLTCSNYSFEEVKAEAEEKPAKDDDKKDDAKDEKVDDAKEEATTKAPTGAVQTGDSTPIACAAIAIIAAAAVVVFTRKREDA